MTVPFTYVITHKTSKIRYYGCRYAKRCSPKSLGTTYFSSSKTVKALIKKEGIDCFRFEVRKTFDCTEKCRLWETKVLRRLRCADSKYWFNKHDGIWNDLSKNHGRKKGSKNKRPMSEKGRNNIRLSKQGEKNPFFGKTHSEESRKKISAASFGQNNPMFGKTSVRRGIPHSEDTKKIMSDQQKLRWQIRRKLS